MLMNGIQTYRKTNVTTADPKRLVLMLYEGAIDNLKRAKHLLAEGDYEAKSRCIMRAQNMINELMCSLDFEKGGQISANLDALYNYCLRRIMHADLKKDLKVFDEIVGILSELLSAWETIFNKPPKPAIDPMQLMETGGQNPVRRMAV